MYHLKGTSSEKSAEMYGEGNERQLCIGDCNKRPTGFDSYKATIST